MGADALAYALGISVKEAQEFIDEYYRNFPDLASNIEKAKQFLIKNGYLTNYFGFTRTWKYHTEEDHGSLREGVNHLVQSPAWNIVQLAMIQIDEEFTKQKMESELILQRYDAIIAEAVDDEVDEVARIMKDKMINVIKPYEGLNRVLLNTDIEIGKNLADLEKYKI